jgi:hypothetical protein
LSPHAGPLKLSLIATSSLSYTACLSLLTSPPTHPRLLHQASLLAPLSSLLNSIKTILTSKSKANKKPEQEEPIFFDLPPPPSPQRGHPDNKNPQDAAVELIQILDRNHHLSFIAGGWVRDRFLGRYAYDVDICSSASNHDLIKYLGHSKVTPLHINTSRVMHGREKFEVTRFKGFRKEPDIKSAFLDASEYNRGLNIPCPSNMLLSPYFSLLYR